MPTCSPSEKITSVCLARAPRTPTCRRERPTERLPRQSGHGPVHEFDTVIALQQEILRCRPPPRVHVGAVGGPGRRHEHHRLHRMVASSVTLVCSGTINRPDAGSSRGGAKRSRIDRQETTLVLLIRAGSECPGSGSVCHHGSLLPLVTRPFGPRRGGSFPGGYQGVLGSLLWVRDSPERPRQSMRDRSPLWGAEGEFRFRSAGRSRSTNSHSEGECIWRPLR